MYKIISYVWFFLGAACYLASIFVNQDRHIELLLSCACNLLFAIWFRIEAKEEKNDY